MEILIDTREKNILHILPYFRRHDIKFSFQKLEFGDYAIKGQESKIVVERKNGKRINGGGFSELKGNLCTKKGRVRFNSELAKATKAKAEFYLLIENAESVNDILIMKKNIKSLRYISNNAYFNIFNEFIFEHNTARKKNGLNKINIVYSHNFDTAKKIIEILIYKKEIEKKTYWNNQQNFDNVIQRSEQFCRCVDTTQVNRINDKYICCNCKKHKL